MTARAVIQKNVRLSLDHAAAMDAAMSVIRANPGRLPETLRALLTDGREVCESDVTGALWQRLLSELSPQKPENT